MNATQEISMVSLNPNKLDMTFCVTGPKPDKPYWHLTHLRVLVQANGGIGSSVEFQLINELGEPTEGVDVVMVWRDGLSCAKTDSTGQACLRLWDRCDPTEGLGPCHASILDDESTEVCGLGIPNNHAITYRLTYMRQAACRQN